MSGARPPVVDVLRELRLVADASGLPVVDMGVGAPVDPTPAVVQAALAAAANAPGYPATVGTRALRDSIRRWMDRRLDVRVDDDEVIPSVGSKELVAMLPRLLDLSAGATVVIPEVAYPTYEVGALFANCNIVATDRPEDVESASLLWLCSPGNPTGAVLSAGRMRELVEWAADRGAVIASDECYAEFGWDVEPTSILHSSVSDGRHDGLLAVHSLSKRSNMAGYRFGFVAGDKALVARMLAMRKHLGLIPAAPIQAAAIAAFDDDEHVAVQRERYRRRRGLLLPALASQGFRIDHSEAGLYLWCTRDEDCETTVRWFADRGIVVTPGSVFGPAGDQHVRMALTTSDADVEKAVERLASQ